MNLDLHETIISQYHAALEMLKETILACPDALWHNPDDGNQFWQVAYHALFYTHLYLQESEETFRPWPGHREEYRLDQEVVEPPAKEVVLDYLAFCRHEVLKKAPALVLDASSGFAWLPFTKFELQLYSIRHIQQHVGELMERLGPQAAGIDWVGSRRPEIDEQKRLDHQAEPTLVELIRYNNWANAQVLAACRKLSHDQLAATAPGAYGSIHRTLGHIIAAEADYVGRLTGAGPQPPFQWHAGPSLAEISDFAGEVAAALLDAVQRIPPGHGVHEEENDETFDYQAGALFIQIVNHGIEHRTNITTILAGLGLPAPEVDGWAYLSAHPERFEMKIGSRSC
jgi:uncharacterized damage-inducible protein DinB